MLLKIQASFIFLVACLAGCSSKSDTSELVKLQTYQAANTELDRLSRRVDSVSGLIPGYERMNQTEKVAELNAEIAVLYEKMHKVEAVIKENKPASLK